MLAEADVPSRWRAYLDSMERVALMRPDGALLTEFHATRALLAANHCLVGVAKMTWSGLVRSTETVSSDKLVQELFADERNPLIHLGLESVR